MKKYERGRRRKSEGRSALGREKLGEQARAGDIKEDLWMCSEGKINNKKKLN